MTAKSPTGKLIVGTLEKLSGRANIVADSFRREEGGKLVFDYEGYTHVFWEEQKTIRRHGAPIFLDEEGFEWEETQVKLSVE